MKKAEAKASGIEQRLKWLEKEVEFHKELFRIAHHHRVKLKSLQSRIDALEERLNKALVTVLSKQNIDEIDWGDDQ